MSLNCWHFANCSNTATASWNFIVAWEYSLFIDDLVPRCHSLSLRRSRWLAVATVPAPPAVACFKKSDVGRMLWTNREIVFRVPCPWGARRVVSCKLWARNVPVQGCVGCKPASSCSSAPLPRRYPRVPRSLFSPIWPCFWPMFTFCCRCDVFLFWSFCKTVPHYDSVTSWDWSVCRYQSSLRNHSRMFFCCSIFIALWKCSRVFWTQMGVFAATSCFENKYVCCECRMLGECHRQPGKSCSVFRVRVVRADLWARNLPLVCRVCSGSVCSGCCSCCSCAPLPRWRTVHFSSFFICFNGFLSHFSFFKCVIFSCFSFLDFFICSLFSECSFLHVCMFYFFNFQCFHVLRCHSLWSRSLGFGLRSPNLLITHLAGSWVLVSEFLHLLPEEPVHIRNMCVQECVFVTWSVLYCVCDHEEFMGFKIAWFLHSETYLSSGCRRSLEMVLPDWRRTSTNSDWINERFVCSSSSLHWNGTPCPRRSSQEICALSLLSGNGCPRAAPILVAKDFLPFLLNWMNVQRRWLWKMLHREEFLSPSYEVSQPWSMLLMEWWHTEQSQICLLDKTKSYLGLVRSSDQKCTLHRDLVSSNVYRVPFEARPWGIQENRSP